jgi:hypothetical protein
MRWGMGLGLERWERRRLRVGVVGRGALALRCSDGAAPVLRASSERTSTRTFRLPF